MNWIVNEPFGGSRKMEYGYSREDGWCIRIFERNPDGSWPEEPYVDERAVLTHRVVAVANYNGFFLDEYALSEMEPPYLEDEEDV